MATEGDETGYAGEQFRDYVERTKLKHLFKGLLQQVLEQQPEDPLGYFCEKIQEIQKEMKESNVQIQSTTFVTSVELDEKNEDPVIPKLN